MQPTLAEWVAEALEDSGLGKVTATETLLVEASHRQFYRVHTTGQTFVVMDSPPDKELNDQFVALALLFRTHGIPVPEIIASDPRGFFLLSDLGVRHFSDAYEDAEADRCLQLAVDQLVDLQAIEDASLPPYTETRLRDELGIFSEWLVEKLVGETVPGAYAGEISDTLVGNALDQPQCCIHRDYHCRNLILGPDGELGIVDFQDALIGPATYDLASLLWDCYHRFDVATIRRWQDYYAERSRFDFGAELSKTVDLMALQRQLKAAGIFARLYLRDGKQSHLQHIMPVYDSMLAIAGDYAETQPLAAWLEPLSHSTAARLEAISS